MKKTLYKFIRTFDRANITPNENHIKEFLTEENQLHLKDDFIRFCFYNWEHRRDRNMTEQLLKTIENGS